MPYLIRRFTSEDSLDQLTALLHRAYAAHAAAGRRFFASYQSSSDTQRRIARGECWIAVDGPDFLGTVTLVAPYQFPEGYPAPRGAGTFYQLAVAPSHLGRGLGGELLAKAEERIHELGVSTIAIDTSRSAAELITWYLRRGYAEAGSWSWSVTNYESIVLVKTVS